VIKGWDLGVATMNKGEKSILKCHHEVAYGKQEQAKIPAESTLLFEVELLDWSKSEDISAAKDKSLTKTTVVEGKDYDKPDYESSVTIDVQIATEGKATEDRTAWTFIIGDTADLPAGLEDGLKSMKKGEQATIHASSKVTGGAPTQYTITLHDFTKVRTWEAKGADKINAAVKRKDEGNTYFKASQLPLAEKKYKRALEFIESDYGLDTDEQKSEAKKVKVTIYSNLAQVNLLRKELKEALTNCNKCLEIDPANVKALFRRGKVNNAFDNWDEARKDLQKVLEIDPSNADAAKELHAVDEKKRALHKKEKALYGNMFEKLSKLEEKEKAAAPAPAPAPEAPPKEKAAAPAADAPPPS